MNSTIFLLSILFLIVLIHEAGHLLLAKYYKVGVPTFSIGFGPRIIGIKFHKGKISYRFFNFKPSNPSIWALPLATEYRIAPIPFGGFCAMRGEQHDSGSPYDLMSKKYYQKVMIAMGGAIANIVTGLGTLITLVATKIGFIKAVIVTYTVLVGAIRDVAIYTYNIFAGTQALSRWSEISSSVSEYTTLEGFLIQFSFLSIIMALFNLLPFPALDGSLPFLWGLEKILGKETGEKVANFLITLGFLTIMALQVALVLYWVNLI